MIGRTLFDALRLVELLVGLCRMRLSGLELATAIMIALGRGDELRQIGRSRAGRHKALTGLREKRLVLAVKRGWIVDEDLIDGFTERIASLSENLRTFRTAIPQLEAAPAFDWLKLTNTERECLHEVLREAAALQCAESFGMKVTEVRVYFDQIAEAGQRRRVLAFARLVKAYSAGCSAFLDQGFENCLKAALNLGGGRLPPVQDPVLVLREWLANSHLAEGLTLKVPASPPALDAASENIAAGTFSETASNGTEVPQGDSMNPANASPAVDGSTCVDMDPASIPLSGKKLPQGDTVSPANASLAVDGSTCADKAPS